jgi:hypothetical protein
MILIMAWGNDGWHRTLERFLSRLFGLGRSPLGREEGVIAQWECRLNTKGITAARLDWGGLPIDRVLGNNRSVALADG